MRKIMDFAGKNILVDGAGRGIGLEVARLLNSLGANVILVDSNKEVLDEALNIIGGTRCSGKEFNLVNHDEIINLVKEIVQENGALDGFVHCVGVRCRRPINLLSPDVLKQVMDINFVSFVELVRCITKKGNFNRGLSIVAISSISAKTGGISVTGYAASKAAIEGAVRCLAHELAPKGVRLNTVQPGQTLTPAYKELIGNNDDPVLERQYLGLAEASDVANTIAFLLDDASRMITGASMPIDCGFYTS